MEIDLSANSRQKSFMPGEVMSESGCPENLPLKPFMMKILANRRPERIAELAKKLNRAGIKQKKSLKKLTKNTIEAKLFEKMKLGEISDVLKVWKALQRSHKGKSKASHSKKTSQVTSKSAKRKRNQHSKRVTSPRASSKDCLCSKYSKVTETTPLRDAVMEGNTDEVQRLLQLGASIEERYRNWTPLMTACERGHYIMALLLLERRADTAAVNNKGRCALSFAAAPSKDDQHRMQRVSQLEIIKLLASHGAKIDREDERGKTPKKHAEESANRKETCDPSFKRDAAAKLLEELENA